MRVKKVAGDKDARSVAVDTRVRLYPGTERESRGVVLEDFGEAAGCAVDVGTNHIADPARRWAVPRNPYLGSGLQWLR